MNVHINSSCVRFWKTHTTLEIVWNVARRAIVRPAGKRNLVDAPGNLCKGKSRKSIHEMDLRMKKEEGKEDEVRHGKKEGEKE